jgi:hypothetical protein
MDPACCRYAGSVGGKDVYQSSEGSVLIRFGSDGPDYSSYPQQIVAMVAEQNETVKQAVEMIKTNIRR